MSITSANATAVCVVPDLFPGGFPLEKFSADASIQQDSRQVAETRMSVDAQFAAGWVPAIKQVTVSLEADSPTLTYLEQLVAAQEQAKEYMTLSITFTVPSAGRSYQYSNGVLQTTADIANGSRVLDPRQFVFHFGNFEAVPLD